jgi:hypothetical protein
VLGVERLGEGEEVVPVEHRVDAEVLRSEHRVTVLRVGGVLRGELNADPHRAVAGGMECLCHAGSILSTVGDSPIARSSTIRMLRATSSTAPMTVPNLSRSAHTAVTTTKWLPVSQV